MTSTEASWANGVAVFSYRLKKQDPVGTYQVTANASMNNAIFGSATTSFTVQ